jgi:hypothetical protein
MTDPTAPRSLDALLADRARLETWLAQVATKAAHLPPHVVAKVEADYRGRLATVVEALRARAEELESEAATLRARVTGLDDALRSAQDARAEDELRALVGEYDAAMWDQRRAAHDRGIAELVSERDARVADRDRVLALLADATRTEAPLVAAPVLTEPAGEVVQAAAEEPAAPQPAAPEPAAAVAEALAVEVPPVEAPAVDAVAAPDVPPPVPVSVDEDPLGDASPDLFGGEAAMAAAPVRDEKALLDEIAFLDSVVGAAVAAEAVLASSASAPAPAAADPQRTLKCQECGTLNVPTEWYCVSCGGELSAF